MQLARQKNNCLLC